MIDDPDWRYAAPYGIAGHPATLLVDAHGRVVGGFYGPADAAAWDLLAAELDRDGA